MNLKVIALEVGACISVSELDKTIKKYETQLNDQDTKLFSYQGFAGLAGLYIQRNKPGDIECAERLYNIARQMIPVKLPPEEQQRIAADYIVRLAGAYLRLGTQDAFWNAWKSAANFLRGNDSPESAIKLLPVCLSVAFMLNSYKDALASLAKLHNIHLDLGTRGAAAQNGHHKNMLYVLSVLEGLIKYDKSRNLNDIRLTLQSLDVRYPFFFVFSRECKWYFDDALFERFEKKFKDRPVNLRAADYFRIAMFYWCKYPADMAKPAEDKAQRLLGIKSGSTLNDVYLLLLEKAWDKGYRNFLSAQKLYCAYVNNNRLDDTEKIIRWITNTKWNNPRDLIKWLNEESLYICKALYQGIPSNEQAANTPIQIRL